MKTVNTCVSNTKVYPIDSNIFRVVIPFDDGSSFTVLVQLVKDIIKPCTAADRFIYSSISDDFQNDIKILCQKSIK